MLAVCRRDHVKSSFLAILLLSTHLFPRLHLHIQQHTTSAHHHGFSDRSQRCFSLQRQGLGCCCHWWRLWPGTGDRERTCSKRREGRADKLKDAEKQDPSGGSIIALQMDVTDKESIQAGVDAISKKEKFVNFLVNNAGVTSGTYQESLQSGLPLTSTKSTTAPKDSPRALPPRSARP
jgi:hypothetical protein